MQILPVKATPTWTGVRVPDGNGSGGTVIVPWCDALDSRSVTRNGERLRVEYAFGHGERLAAAFRRRHVRNVLRSGGTIRWSNSDVPGTIGERLGAMVGMIFTLFAFGTLLWIILTPIVTNGPGSVARGLPTGLAVLTWGVWLLFFFGVIAGGVLFVKLFTMQREGLTSGFEMTRDRLVIHRRAGVSTIDASDIISMRGTLSGRSLKTTTSLDVPIRDIPGPLLHAWLGMCAPSVYAEAERAQARSMRAAAAFLLIGSLVVVTMAMLFSTPDERPSPLAMLVVVPIMPVVMVYAARHDMMSQSRRARRAT
jgi:hypothetical protein